MLESQTAAIQRLQELAMHISALPTVDDVNRMMKNYYQNIYDRQTDFLSKTIREEHQRMTNTVTTNMDKTTDTIGWKLQVDYTQHYLIIKIMLCIIVNKEM